MSKFQNLGEIIPVQITTGLARASHIVVVAREDAQELLAQTVSRIAGKDYFEAHQGGTIQVTQHVHVSNEELSELGNLLEDTVSNRLRALGIDLVVYGKFFETPSDRIRLDVYLLDVLELELQQAEGLETGEEQLSNELNAVVDHLAASVQAYLAGKRHDRLRKTFAVLPFRNISQDPKWNVWREGLTEELITVLKNARGLQLIERAVTNKYKDVDDLDIAKVGRELEVDVVLWGSYDVFENENNERRIIIRARLVETETGNVLNTFKEQGKVDYTAQASLAQQIMEELNVQPSSIQEVKTVPTTNLDALDYVRIGIHHYDRQDFSKAIQAFQDALGYDPSYSEAHYHLGNTYKTLESYDKALESFKAALGSAYDKAFGRILWKFDTGWKIFATPVISGNTLYIGPGNNSFYALNKHTGDLIWRQSLRHDFKSAHTITGNLILVADQWIYSIDPKNGETRWSVEMEGNIHDDLSIDAETIYVVTSKENEKDKKSCLNALDTNSGKMKWEFKLSGILGAPLAIGGQLAVGADDLNLYLFDGESGKQIWKTKLGGPVNHQPATIEQTVFAAISDTIYALNLLTGHIRWQLTADTFCTCPPVVDGEIIYAAFDNKIYAIDRHKGLLNWIHTSIFRIGSLSAANGLVFATSNYMLGQVGEHILLVIDQDTGQAYWEHTFSDTIYGKPTIQDGTLYIGNRNHIVYAINIQRTRVGIVRSSEIWSQIAEIHLLQKNSELAIQACENSIEIDPTFRKAYQKLFEIYREQKRLARAIIIQQKYMSRLDEREKAAAEQDLRQVSGLLWTYDTPGLFSMTLVPLAIEKVGNDDSGFSPIVPRPCVADDKVFMGLPDGSFIALRTNTGDLEWSYRLKTEALGIRSSAAVWSGHVYFGAGDGAIYALNQANGKLSWKFQTKGQVDSTPLVVDGILYAGSDDGNVYALHADSGKRIWSINTSGRIKSSPALHDGTIYIGSYDGGLYALDAIRGNVKWRFETNDIINSSPRLRNGVVYLGPDDTWIYAIDAADGTLKWKFQVEEESKSALRYGLLDGSGLNTFGFLPSTPVFDCGTLIVGSNGGNDCQIYALDADTGALKWKYLARAEIGSPAVNEGIVFVGAGGVLFHDQTLYGINAEDGSLVWQFKTEGDVLSEPAIMNGFLYCWSLKGKLYAFDVRGVRSNTPERDANFYVRAGDVHSKNGRIELALEAYKQARNLDPRNPSSHAGLADCYESLGQLQLQAETLEQFQTLAPQATHSYWRLGTYYLQQKHYDKAIIQFSDYIKILDESKKGIGYTMLGDTYLQMGNEEKALEQYESAIQFGVKYFVPKYGTQQDETFAMRGLFMAFHRKAAILYGQNLDLEEHLDMEVLEQAKELLDFDIPPSYYEIRGYVLSQKGEHQQASQFLEQALQSDPTNSRIMGQLGAIYLELKQLKKAAKVLEEALKLSPDDINLLTNLAITYHEHLFQFEKAYRYAQLACEAKPSDLALKLNLAEFSFTVGQYDESHRLASEVIAESSDKQYGSIARLYICMARLMVGDDGGAAEALGDLIQFQKDKTTSDTWAFDGTLKFLQDQTDLNVDKRKFLICLIDFSRGKADQKTLFENTPPGIRQD